MTSGKISTDLPTSCRTCPTPTNQREPCAVQYVCCQSHRKPNCRKSPPASQLQIISKTSRGLTKKAEPPPTRDVNRDSGTASANGGWLRRLVRPRRNHKPHQPRSLSFRACLKGTSSSKSLIMTSIWTFVVSWSPCSV